MVINVERIDDGDGVINTKYAGIHEGSHEISKTYKKLARPYV